jgi:uncharacterized membrane protein
MNKKKANSSKAELVKIFSPHFSKVGVAMAVVFFSLSLFPSMLPRTYIIQSIISAISLTIGYGIGTFSEWLWKYLQIPSPKGKARSIVTAVLVSIIGFTVMSATWQAVGWQNSVRAVFGEESIGFTYIVFGTLLTVVISVLIILIARSIRKLYQYLAVLINKKIPRRLSVVISVLLVFLLINFIYTGVLTNTFFAVANQLFSTMDVKINPKHPQPITELSSGSANSLVAWDTMGKQGRKFVATKPTSESINSVTNSNAIEPIRVYAGVNSADTIEQRADLVLNELIRTKAFDRKALLLVTTTGSGWIDGKAIEPFEYMNNGDSATAGVQYSYLPSWISLLADQSKVKDTSTIVFNKVYDYWAKLPEESRPDFYLYGLSLGSFGVENIINSVELVNEPIDGAFLAGPPFVNELHTRLENERDSNSPEWQPIINNGTTVRFVASENALSLPSGQWGSTKIAYLQHATDPVVWFSQNLLLEEPDWLKQGQKGPGIIEEFVWIPIVTMWQMAADLPAAGSVKDGYGHNYSTDENIYIWSALTNPPEWTKEKENQLIEYFSTITYEGA